MNQEQYLFESGGLRRADLWWRGSNHHETVNAELKGGRAVRMATFFLINGAWTSGQTYGKKQNWKPFHTKQKVNFKPIIDLTAKDKIIQHLDDNIEYLHDFELENDLLNKLK